MEKSYKHEPQMTFQAQNQTMETEHPGSRAGHTLSELLEDSGNCRQIISREPSLLLLSDSLFSEQQKLRHVLDWAHSFLSSGSEVHHEFCRADSLILADEERREKQKRSPSYKHSSAAKYHHPVSGTAGDGEVFVSDNATCSIKESTACWKHLESKVFGSVSNLKNCYKTAGAHSESDISGRQMELSKGKAEGKVGTQKEVTAEDAWRGVRRRKVNEEQEVHSTFAVSPNPNSEPKKPPALTVSERYQLCVDQLHRLREQQSQRIEPGCFMDSPAKDRKKSEEIAPQNPGIKTCPNKAGSKGDKAAETTKDTSSGTSSINDDGSEYNRSRATLTEHKQTKHCEKLAVKKTPAAICAESGHVHQRITVSNTHKEHLETDPVPAVEESAALATNPGLFSKTIRHNSDIKGSKRGVKGQRKKIGGRGASFRICDKSSVPLCSPIHKENWQRLQSSGINKHTDRHTPEDKVKPVTACRQTHKCLPPTETHTPLHADAGASGAYRCRKWNTNTYKYSPAGVPECERWLCLPNEVWLSILSLLPHRDLCRVLQVCSRLHTLATDHTLWRNLRMENSTLTERWLLCVGRRHPRSLCLYSCSGLTLTSCGLEMFFTLCRNFLEELRVTGCTGPALHGDQMLPLIGQLCHRVTSVDVSWSGATDTGVKALSDCCPGLKLKSVILNGCHVTDDPLMKLVMRHKDSLCRLELFGCQFLTPPCLQKVYEMCPGLRHLNIGQVPKVNAHSLTVMMSQLRCLISLNLTGLQTVTDATVDTLLQNCAELQSLTFSSCPGVTDLTLHSIRKYTPCIRSLDVSGCKAVTDAGVQSLALGCRRLEHLDVSSTNTGNRGVTLLANYCSRHLHTVKLSFCHITLENILKLCRHCRRLKVLHLYGCARLPTEREIREVNAAVKVYPLP